jgi:hypothetical protein
MPLHTTYTPFLTYTSRYVAPFASPCIIIRFKQINQQDATVSPVYYLKFMCGSTCFGRLSAHHQERTTALEASGFTVGAWRLEHCWSWTPRPITLFWNQSVFNVVQWEKEITLANNGLDQIRNWRKICTAFWMLAVVNFLGSFDELLKQSRGIIRRVI